jgi:hypothetical protein
LYIKQNTLTKVSTVLSLPLQLGFPGFTFTMEAVHPRLFSLEAASLVTIKVGKII